MARIEIQMSLRTVIEELPRPWVPVLLPAVRKIDATGRTAPGRRPMAAGVSLSTEEWNDCGARAGQAGNADEDEKNARPELSVPQRIARMSAGGRTRWFAHNASGVLGAPLFSFKE